MGDSETGKFVWSHCGGSWNLSNREWRQEDGDFEAPWGRLV